MSSEGFTVWLTGLPCSGKSTLATALSRLLVQAGRRVEVLDGDVVRQNLCQDLGFSREDRDLNIARVTFVSGLLARNGVAVVVATVSPYRKARDEARAQLTHFVEVHVTCPVIECERRDVKGMYKRARAGTLQHFTGVDDPYEEPLNPEIRVDTSLSSIVDSVELIFERLKALGHLPAIENEFTSSTQETSARCEPATVVTDRDQPALALRAV